MIENSVKVSIKTVRDPEETKLIQETERRLQAALRDDYGVYYNGDLSWIVRPLIKTLKITGGLRP
jgi:hypothetical protein